jgi:septal ring factor EnvC (AmiA/AmiB activator)
MKRIGPTRLILLNCGKFDYAEVNLDSPLHLVGPNNIGKTSLIAILQYLYIDHQSKMKFSRDITTSRKYYFPDVSSFALFESLGPEGFMLTGVHGLGPVKQYEIERFSYQGQFDRNDYLSMNNSILPWDEIKANLSHKNYTNLKSSDLRAALMGNENRRRREKENFTNLSLVPLHRKDEYERFCNVFLNLLRLSHLRQDELKELLLQLFDGEFTKREIDLQEQFAPQLEQLQRQKADVYDLKRNEPAIRRILEGIAKRNHLRGMLKALYSRIGNSFYAYKMEVDNQCKSIDIDLRKCRQIMDENETKKQSLENQREQKNQELGSLKRQMEDWQRLEKQFAQYNVDWANVRISELEAQLRNIESNLDMVQSGSPESIQARLSQNELKLSKRIAHLEDIDSSFIARLMKHFNEQEIDKLSRLFNDDILMLSVADGMASVDITDYNLLCQYLDRILDSFSENRYTNDAISLNLDNVHHFDIKEYMDPERIRDEIHYIKKEVQRTRDALHAAKHQQELIQQKVSIKNELVELQDERSQYRKYIASTEANSDLPKKLKSIEEELAILHEQLIQTQEKDRQNERKKIDLENEQNALRSQYEQMQKRVSDICRPSVDWEEIDYDTKGTGLTEMLDFYNRTSNEHQHLADKIEGELETIHSQTYGRYQADNEKESLQMLQNELNTLDERQKALEENWMSFTVQLKKDFRELNRDMEKLLAKVSKLNSDLSKIHISNLSNLRINVLIRTELKRYIDQVEDSEQTPLFTDSSQTDEVIRKISRILQEKPVISLQDMFDMHFEITTPNGELKTYDHLDRIESNGTTITIKVLINLILLRGLLANESVYVPFYLDECSSLDSENLRSIVEQAREQGFTAILASPEAMDAADHIYYLSENKGRVTLNPQNSLVKIVRN